MNNLYKSRQTNTSLVSCRTLKKDNKRLLYNTFVECYFNYCSVVCHFCPKQETYKLEKLQMKALRYIFMVLTYEQL